MKFGGERDTLEGFLRDLDTRLTRQERHTHNLLPSGGVVVIGGDVSGGGGGVVGGGGGGGTAINEVFVGAAPPADSSVELWYDPDAVATEVMGPPGVGVPPGGTVQQVLGKTSGANYATSWRDPTWLVVKDTQPTAADYGLTTIPVGAIWVQA